VKRDTQLTPSRQCYLGQILLLQMKCGRVRQSELAARIRVNKSSVTGALRALARSGMILYEPYGSATLTPEGRRAAEGVVRRWALLRDFLMRTLEMREGAAVRAAYEMHNSMPEAVMELIARRLEQTWSPSVENRTPCGSHGQEQRIPRTLVDNGSAKSSLMSLHERQRRTNAGTCCGTRDCTRCFAHAHRQTDPKSCTHPESPGEKWACAWCQCRCRRSYQSRGINGIAAMESTNSGAHSIDRRENRSLS
jgi:Mn-dependent DtxR family transcriptional regulator